MSSPCWRGKKFKVVVSYRDQLAIQFVHLFQKWFEVLVHQTSLDLPIDYRFQVKVVGSRWHKLNCQLVPIANYHLKLQYCLYLNYSATYYHQCTFELSFFSQVTIQNGCLFFKYIFCTLFYLLVKGYFKNDLRCWSIKLV
jgi:hypothetical protein